MSKVPRSSAQFPGVRTLTTAGLVAVVGAIVLGILGMHGLSQHGTMPSHSDHQPVATASTETGMHTGHAAITHATTVTGDPAAIVAAGDAGGSVGHMAMLCAAMVIAAAGGVYFVLWLRRCAHGTVLGITPRVRAVPTLVRDRLDTGPPAVWRFSVVRC